MPTMFLILMCEFYDPMLSEDLKSHQQNSLEIITLVSIGYPWNLMLLYCIHWCLGLANPIGDWIDWTGLLLAQWGDAASAIASGVAFALGGFHHTNWSYPMGHLEVQPGTIRSRMEVTSEI